ncbi:MAG: GntR family transcriptional regulator [Limnochordia bacterium]|jgi:DNA-binding GntR family transcriptional regulator
MAGKKRSVVYQEILENILALKYGPGTRLLEEELAAELSVSRTPVREALFRLRNEGLVTVVPGGGARVIEFTVKDVVEIYALRERLEGLATRMAAQYILVEEIGRLGELVKDGTRAAEAQDLDLFRKINLTFHQQIIEAANSPRIGNMLQIISNQVVLLMNSTAAIPGSPGKATAEHQEIIDALASRASDRAEEAAVKHVRRAREEIIAQLTY